VLNAAPAQPLTAELLSVLDVLIVNETELDAIAGVRGDIRTRLESIDVPCVIATLGARGCQARHGNEFLTQPGFAVTPVDTTAAGDAFCGVLTAALADHLSLPDALRMASAAGALTCTRHGAQASIPTRAELQAFLGSR
jgi:ribokinase